MKTKLLATVAGFLAVTALRGQEIRTGDRLLQVFGPPITGVRSLDEGFSNRVVRAKPFSATEERHFVQILGDGTRIEINQENKLYRDSQGRTRTEQMNGVATIFDPVAGSRVELDPATKTARRTSTGPPIDLAGNYLRLQRSNPGNTAGVTSETTENLRSQTVNGVTAQGVRTVMTIPRGEIGNDREIKVLTERWVSDDLQMLIRSTNSDPRFGETTYQLTGIVQQEPDASLFRIPDGYTELNGGRGGTRSGGAVAPAGRGRGGKQP